MAKQQYELGTKVWAFKQYGQKKELFKAFGVIRSAEIDPTGYVFYNISTLQQTKEGIKQVDILANHASIAMSEAEIDKKMALYHEFQEQQKALFEDRIGAPEFTPGYVEQKLTEGE